MGTPVRSAADDEAAATEALELVALAERLADALEALRPDAHELAAREHPLGVLGAGEGGTALAGQRAHDRHLEDEVGAERAQEAAGVVVHRQHGHQAVERDGAGVVGDHQRAALGGDVLQAADLEPEPLLGDRAQRRHEEALGQLAVEAVVVHDVVAVQPATYERHQLGGPALPVVAEDLHGRRPGAPAASRPPGCRPAGCGPRWSRPGGAGRRVPPGRTWQQVRARSSSTVFRAAAGLLALREAAARGAAVFFPGARLRAAADGRARPVPRPGRPPVPIGMTSASRAAASLRHVRLLPGCAHRRPRRSRRRPRPW